jgi:hypothetical protein
MGGRTRLELRQQPAEREELGGFFCFRFRKRISLGKFLHVNLSKSGASLSVGRRAPRSTSVAAGTTAHVRIPSSGVSYSKRIGKRRQTAGPLLLVIAIEVAAVIVVL